MDPDEITKDEIIATIKYREQLIERAVNIVSLSNTIKANLHGVTARELVNLAKQLREHGIRCVQKIVGWTLSNTAEDSTEPNTFLWNGVEYLCKMYSDLDFISEKINPSLKHHGGFAIGDPFFISKGGGDNSHRRAGIAATLIVLDAIERRRMKFGVDFDSGLDTNSTEEVSDDISNASSRRKSGLVVHRRRRGITDLYKSQSSADEAAAARTNPILQRSLSSQESIVFRGRKLYRRGHKLGSGAYATVYACERQDGERFAVKAYDISGNPTPGEDEGVVYARKCYTREVDIMRTLHHPNIIALEDSLMREGIPYVVMERMSCTLLEVQMDRPSTASESLRGVSLPSIEKYSLSVLDQLSGGLAHMHSLNMIHRDIKPENILVTMSAKRIVAKIGDLGSAIKLAGNFGGLSVDFNAESDLTHYVGSRWYRAPETLGHGNDYGPSADIWSLGCTISEFITGSPLFEGSDEQEVLDSIISLFPDHQIPQGMTTHMLDKGLEFKSGLATKRSIHHILRTVSSALRKVVESMICIAADDRYSASGIQRDVNELLKES